VARRRLDAELVRRATFSSREQARSAIESGRVSVAGLVATKPATQVEDSAAIEVDRAHGDYVSRGAHKLIGALDDFGLEVAGRRALDAGASTGGFTQVLLERGARQVLAVDVGYGQIAWSLRSDNRVVVLERTNVRHLSGDALPYRPEVIVADLSFISLTKVLPALVDLAAADCQFVLMVKPQFEVGRELVGSGVITDPLVRIRAVETVAQSARGLGLAVQGVAASQLPGPKGNVEYFLWMTRSGSDEPASDRKDVGMNDDATTEAITRAVREGPV